MKKWKRYVKAADATGVDTMEAPGPVTNHRSLADPESHASQEGRVCIFCRAVLSLREL